MKCIQAIKSSKDYDLGEIRRVDDKMADNMVGSSWKFISKSEWKLATRKQKEEMKKESVNDQITDSVTQNVKGKRKVK